MDCMQSQVVRQKAKRSQVTFQYRKRYGLHAIMNDVYSLIKDCDKFQYRKRYGLHAIKALNEEMARQDAFQYRKRYGLHAILSPRTLENSEPKRWFSSTPSLFAPFPKPQGIFLSQKAVQKGCKASNIKETFVHEENLKLMTSFRKSRTSL